MSRIGYVLKVYPRFSETFIVTEILAREAIGDELMIFALRHTSDTRFHSEIARVAAPVQWIPRPYKGSEQWKHLTGGLLDDDMRRRFAQILPVLAELPADEAVQAVGLARAARAGGITHLHAHFASLAGRVTWAASQLAGIPYTVTTHAKDIFHESVDMQWLRRISADAERVIAISRFNEDYLTEVLEGSGARIRLLRNGIELSRFPFKSAAPLARPLRILAVGRLVPKKGFDDLLDAADILRQRGYDASIDIAGEGELHDHLAQRIEDLGLAQIIHLIGAQTQTQIRTLLTKAHVFVAPCRIAEDGNMDGLPTVVLEAMATGTPVIATAVTGLPEVVRNMDTGILLDPGRADLLAEALIDVMNGRLDRERMAERARALIDEFFDSHRQGRLLSAWEAGEGRGRR